MLETLKEQLALLHHEIPKNDLVCETGGNVSARDPEPGAVASFMRAHLFSTLAALKTRLDILFIQEQAEIDEILGHGGFFKTEFVGQKNIATALNVPVSVMAPAGEGGAWRMALLAAFVLHNQEQQPQENAPSQAVFSGNDRITIRPAQEDVEGFDAVMERYNQGLEIERKAVEVFR